MDRNGTWISEKECLKNLAVTYYKDLFSAESPLAEVDFLRGCFPLIKPVQKLELEKEISWEEVWNALKKMGPLKAPGPNGFPAIFFQRTWNAMVPASVDFVKKLPEKAEVNPEANESFLVLIPMK